MNAILLGSNPITNAVGKVLLLFNVNCSDANNGDILIMVDGDTYSKEKLKGICRGHECIIYLESSRNGSGEKTHPLCYLSDVFPKSNTYRRPLEKFDIIDFSNMLKKIMEQSPDMVSLPSGMKIDDVFTDSVFSKLHIKPLCLKSYANNLVNTYLHTIKNCASANVIIATKLLRSFTVNDYKQFIVYFNSKNQWKKGYDELKKVIGALRAIGYDDHDYTSLLELEKKFVVLESFSFPENGKSPEILQTLRQCVRTFEGIEDLGKGGYQ